MCTFLKPLPAGREIESAHEIVDSGQRHRAKGDTGARFYTGWIGRDGTTVVSKTFTSEMEIEC